VLQEVGKAMNCQEMIEVMGSKGYWKSPGGKTPAATLYSAILRETKVKGAEARFKKTERGKFQLKRKIIQR
jgi:HB1, ASXL, restriction endonuclease HTH domain